MVEQAFQEFGRLDLLVNNAGYQVTHDHIGEFTTEEFDRTFRTNVYPIFWLTRRRAAAHAPRQRDHQHGLDSGVRSEPDLVAVCGDEIGHRQHDEDAVANRHETRRSGECGCAGSGLDAADSLDVPQESVKKFGADTVYGRAAQPVEIAPAFVFLASNESRYVSGEVYGVTGGQMPY